MILRQYSRNRVSLLFAVTEGLRVCPLPNISLKFRFCEIEFGRFWYILYPITFVKKNNDFFYNRNSIGYFHHRFFTVFGTQILGSGTVIVFILHPDFSYFSSLGNRNLRPSLLTFTDLISHTRIALCTSVRNAQHCFFYDFSCKWGVK